jgi:Leucine-rich repeat (LRR) protein
MQDKMNSKALEDLGEEYYKELLSRNLLEPDESYYSNSACIVHDVIRSCARYIIKDEGALISEGQDANRILISSPKLRHLSISNKTVMIDSLQKQASLRTLMLFGSTTVELKDLLNHLSFLRVLYLDNVNLVELPDSICHLKHTCRQSLEI